MPPIPPEQLPPLLRIRAHIYNLIAAWQRRTACVAHSALGPLILPELARLSPKRRSPTPQQD